MTDSAKTPMPVVPTGNAVEQFLILARKISDAPNIEGAPNGGVTLNYSPDGERITGTFTIPLERVVIGATETVRPVNFVREN